MTGAPSHQTDLDLAARALDGDEEATSALTSQWREAVTQIGARMGLATAEVDELFAEVTEKLLLGSPSGAPAGLSHYAGRGSLLGFVRVSAARLAVDRFRKRRREETLDEAMLNAAPAPGDDPELLVLKGRYRDAFQRALRAALAALDVRSQDLLHHHLLGQVGIDGLGELYGVHRSTVARWLEKARRDVAEGTRERLTAELGVDGEELASILRMVRSQIDLTFSGLR